MFRIITEQNNPLRLTKSELSFVQRNNILSIDNIPKDYSFPFILPIAGNERAFKYLHNIDTQDRSLSFPVNLEVNGNLFFKGNIKLDRADNDYYRATLQSEINTDEDLTKTLPQLFAGETIEYSDEDDGTPLAMNGLSWPEVGYCWPSWQNDDEYFLGRYLYDRANPYVSGASILSSGSGIVPLNACLYIAEALQMIANKLGYTAHGTFFSESDLTQLFLWNNNILRWNAGVISIQKDRLFPDITVSEFFNNIRALGITTDIDNINRKLRFDVMNTIYDQRDKTAVDQSMDRIYEIEFSEFDGFCQDIEFPDDYGSKLRADISKLTADHVINWPYEMGIQGDPPTCYFVEGVIVCFNSGEIILTEGENSWYEWDENDGYQVLAYNADKYCIDNGELEAPPVLTMVMHTNAEKQLLPRVDHEVSDLNQYRPFGFKALFFRGTTQNVSGENYAFATPDNYRMSTVGPKYWEKFGKYSLLPNREDSLSRKILYPFFEKLTLAKQYHGVLHGDWRVKHRFNNLNHLRIDSTNFMWKELQFSLNESGFGPTEVRMIKIT